MWLEGSRFASALICQLGTIVTLFIVALSNSRQSDLFKVKLISFKFVGLTFQVLPSFLISNFCILLVLCKSYFFQVGACIVNSENKIVGIGYNGMPNGCSDDVLPWTRAAAHSLDTKYPYGKATCS